MDKVKQYHKLFPPLWNGFEAGSLLGSGSFGDVYELKRQGSDEVPTEAFKEIAVPPPSAGGLTGALFQGLDIDGAKYYYDGMRKKALEEVEILRQFSDCPNIINIHDYKLCELPEGQDEYGWILFVRMELLQPLKQKVLQEGLNIHELVHLTIDLCTALEVCYTKGIIHRDIKPENIFYSPASNAYKLGDFGIACYASRATEEKGLPGTLTHMAPEVYCGKPFDHASDLYAVGMILYKFLNENRVPFLPDYPEKYSPALRNQAIRKRLEGESIPLPSIVRKADREISPLLKTDNITKEAIYQLSRIASKSISADRDKRYSSPAELKQAIMNWQNTIYAQGDHHAENL